MPPGHTWAEGRRDAGAAGTREADRDPAAARSPGAPARWFPGSPSPSRPAHPRARQPISAPRAAPLPHHTPSPPPGPSPAAVCPSVRICLALRFLSAPLSLFLSSPCLGGRRSGLALTSSGSLPQFPSRSLSVGMPGCLPTPRASRALGGHLPAFVCLCLYVFMSLALPCLRVSNPSSCLCPSLLPASCCFL